MTDRQYETVRDAARAAIRRQHEASTEYKEALTARDDAIATLLGLPGTSLGSVARDLGISKSTVALVAKSNRKAKGLQAP